MKHLALLASLAFAYVFCIPAEAATGLVQSCTNTAMANRQLNDCRAFAYVVPVASSLVASRPTGNTCTWAGAECQWRRFDSLTAHQVRTCPLDRPVGTAWVSGDPCGGSHVWVAAAVTPPPPPPPAQRSMTFTSSAVSGSAGLTATLTWSSTPPALDCDGTGDWTGSKGPSGTATVSVPRTSTYNLTCRWPGGVGEARLKFTPATHNSDGSPYTNPGNIVIAYGRTTAALTTERLIAPNLTDYTITDLAEGTWFVAASSQNSAGIRGVRSGAVQKVVEGPTTLNRAIGITIDPAPNPPGIE